MLERESAFVLDVEGGFCIYKLLENSLYLQDIFVVKELRKTGLTRKMFNQIKEAAIVNAKPEIIGSVVVGSPGAEHSVAIMLAEGFKMAAVENNVIWFSYEVKHGRQ